ncbi:3-hydroxy-3-methylglutaryl-coenzyme A (HMG-CoA) reductase isozyme, partial [Kappamyces sp. JEL0680]
MKPLLASPSLDHQNSEKSLSSRVMERGKLIGMLTFVFGHVVTASGNVAASSMTDAITTKGQSSLLLPLENADYLVRVGKSHTLNPTWIPQQINNIIPVASRGPSFITPQTVLVVCVFFAASACVAVLVSQNASGRSKKAQPASVPAAPAQFQAAKSPVQKDVVAGPAETLPRADSGTEINDELLVLADRLKNDGAESLTDEDILSLVDGGKIAPYALEKTLGNFTRAVKIRRSLVSRVAKSDLNSSLLPLEHYDYSTVFGVCCENVIGYLPLPVGVAGPMLIDNDTFQIPMATTEGCLVASTSRGCKAITLGGGARTEVVNDGMSRGPVVTFPGVRRAAEMKRWIDEEGGFDVLKASFESTSRFAKLSKIKVALSGKLVFLRFVTKTGDAMGMNMISKGVEKSLS